MNIADFVGIPFQTHGRTVQGCDCWGLVRLYYLHIFNIKLPLYHECYATVDDQRAIDKAIIEGRSDWEEIEPVKGAVVLTRMLDRSTHLGVLIEPNLMLHASKSVDSHIVKLTSPLWNNRILGYFKYARFNR